MLDKINRLQAVFYFQTSGMPLHREFSVKDDFFLTVQCLWIATEIVTRTVAFVLSRAFITVFRNVARGDFC